MESARTDFAKKSLEKSKGFNEDQLIKFVILWLGLNALYDDPYYGKGEAEKVKYFFQQNERTIREIIHKREKELQEMQKVIQDHPQQHEKIYQFLQSRRALFNYKHSDSVTHLRELLNKVRNNMFHAVKDWEEVSEQKLISTINPILEDILSELTST
jgi:hypothetical protein